jgi:hypothetical protein
MLLARAEWIVAAVAASGDKATANATAGRSFEAINISRTFLNFSPDESRAQKYDLWVTGR